MTTNKVELILVNRGDRLVVETTDGFSLVAISSKGTLIRYTHVPEHLGFQLDELGRIRII